MSLKYFHNFYIYIFNYIKQRNQMGGNCFHNIYIADEVEDNMSSLKSRLDRSANVRFEQIHENY